nr:TauD/TfdA family dioxygenase [Micromonospora sp. ANENR4]
MQNAVISAGCSCRLQPPNVATGYIELDPCERQLVSGIATELAAAPHSSIQELPWIDLVRRNWERMPERVRQFVRAFRRYGNDDGYLLVRGLPAEAGPLEYTPNGPASVRREPSVPAAVLMLFATGLGDPVAYQPEKSGGLVQDVVPVPGMETFQGNAGSTAVLSFHVENAFHEHRPEYITLLCLRADHEGEAGLRIASIRRALRHLDGGTVDVLSAAEFRTAAPPSFGHRDRSVPHAILTGEADLRVDLSATTATTERAAAAVRALTRALEAVAVTIHLEPGDWAIVDNRTAVHGRSPFTPRYDGYDRWLQRTYIATDLRRSRSLRPGDGHVIVG